LTAIFDMAKSAWLSSMPGRVHADEDLGDGLDVEVFGQLDDADVVVDDLAELLEHLADLRLAVGVRGLRAQCARQFGQLASGAKTFGHVLDPGGVLLDGRVGDLEALLLRVEGDADADRLVVLGQHLAAEQRGHERGDALLAVDQDALARRMWCRP
jgi:hypothetical protein